MGWTKETLKKTCILITSRSQGKRALAFYKSFGFIILDKYFGIGCFIRVAKYDENIISIHPNQQGKTQIKVPSVPRRKFPREMMVSDDKKIWIRRIVYGKIKTNKPFIVHWIYSETYEGFKYAKELEQIQKVNLEDIESLSELAGRMNASKNPDFDWEAYEKATLENQI